jgi:endonuclease YncB( thermonuclease family)
VEKERGLAATAYVNEQAPVGSKVVIKTYKDDKYGRILGEIFVGDTNLNTLLTVEGHAVRYEK